jgi:precorrin-6Y C5,15-methyltransferase (decarboxylating)
MGKIFVVGTGPGSEEFITPAAKNAIAKADVIVGMKKCISLFEGKKSKIANNLEEILNYIKSHKDKDIAILASGDPGFYSILNLILKNFHKKQIEVIPGISSMQLCFAKMKEGWENCKFVSLHGREGFIDLGEKTVVLTDEKWPPNKLAKFLLERGIEGRAWVCDSLCQAGEKIAEGSLSEIASAKFSGNCVMVIKPKKTWHHFGMPDENFTDGAMTKQEIRAITLSKAGICEKSIVYDIGAGAGSISIEAALLAKKGKVFSIERDPLRLEAIRKNAEKFKLLNIEMILGEAPRAIYGLPQADAIIIGGSGGKIKEILEACERKLDKKGKIVVNAIKKQTLKNAIEKLRDMKFDFGITEVKVTRIKDGKRTELNPVCIIDANRKNSIKDKALG